jgi:hypothetical protein
MVSRSRGPYPSARTGNVSLVFSRHQIKPLRSAALVL